MTRALKVWMTASLLTVSTIGLVACGTDSEAKSEQNKSVIKDSAENAINKANDAVKISEEHAKKLEEAGQ